MIVACIALGGFAEKAFGRKDPSQVTSDEWAGQAVTLMFLPMLPPPPQSGTLYTWLLVAGVAFIAFRLLDIIKPPPARQFEKLPRGWGVLLDDLMAGVYANIICQLVLRLGFHLT